MATNPEASIITRYDDEEQPSTPRSLSSRRRDPFDDLATEIIEEIFRYACPTVELPARLLGHVLSSYNRQHPEILSMICKRWRAIYAANHSLWATITIRTHNFNLDNSEIWGPEQLRRCLGKSGAHPLSILIKEYSHTLDAETVISSILDIILLHSERWRTITFQCGLGREIFQKFDTINGRLPLLEYVEFMLSEDTYPEDIPDCTAFLSAPNLSGIGIIPRFGMAIPRKIRLPRTQISEVTFRSCKFGEKDFRDMLGWMSVSLTSLTFPGSFYSGTVGPFSRTVTLPRLRQLRLLYDCGDILSLLICPALEELEIFSGDEEMITKFLDSSSCALTHFKSLCPLSYYDPTAYDIVLRHPSLSTLRCLSLAEVMDEYLDLDLLNFDSNPILRSLETLRLYFRIQKRPDYSTRPQLPRYIDKLQQIIASRTRKTSLHHPEFLTDDHQAKSTEDQRDTTTSLENCFFHFSLETESPEKVGYWDEEPILALKSFCISRKIIVSLKISHTWKVYSFYRGSIYGAAEMDWDLDFP